MLRVTIDLVPGGRPDSVARTIGIIEIANIQTYPDGTADYAVALLKQPPYRGALKEAWRRGKASYGDKALNSIVAGEDAAIITALVTGHHRTKRGAADLKAAIARAEAAEKRASMLERALAPFATHYQAWMDRYADNITSSTFPIHTFGDLRRARDALRRGLPVDPCEAAQSVLNQAAAAIQAVLDGIERADDEAP